MPTITRTIEIIKGNFSLGIFSIGLITSIDFANMEILPKAFITEDGLLFGPDNEPPPEISQYHKVEFSVPNHNPSGEWLLGEFSKMLMRNFTTEIFEAVKSHCKETNKVKVFQSQSWYPFASTLRNCLAHNHVFRFTERQKKYLPAQWHDKIITLDMEGQPANWGLYDWWDGMKLWEEMYQFASSLE